MIQIQQTNFHSSSDYFPKTFDVEIDGLKVASILEANQLNGQNKSMIINIEPIKGKTICFINKGPNWNKKSNKIHIKRIELLSKDEEENSKEIFKKIVESSENKDPHKSGINIYSSQFDFNSFFLLDNKSNICTYHYENSWFQIELTNSYSITAFRLKKLIDFKYKIIATDDLKKPFGSWYNLFDVNNEYDNKRNLLDIYDLPRPSPPVRFIRLIQKGKNSENNFYLVFYHFDFFGFYFSYNVINK